MLISVMVYHGRAPWRLLERKSAMAFVAAGASLLGLAALYGVQALFGTSVTGWPAFLFGSFGLLAAFVGLAGLYPGLAGRVPILGRVGIGIIIMAGISLLLFPLCALVQDSGVSLPVPPITLFVVAMLAIILAFLLFGVASLRSGVPSRTVGWLMLTFGSMFIVLFVSDLVTGGNTPPVVNFGVSGVQAALLLTTGYILPTDPYSVDSQAYQPDVTSG